MSQAVVRSGNPVSQHTGVVAPLAAALPVLLGLILLSAGLLKGYELATAPMVEDHSAGMRLALAGLVEFECFLGLWLLAGMYTRLARLVSLLCFGAFLVYSLYEGLNGKASCECFGKVSVNPWHVAVLDTVALVALWRWPAVDRLRLIPRYSRIAAVSVCLALVLAAAGATAIISNTPSFLSADGEIDGTSADVVLAPEKWVGKPFPLLKHTNIANALTTGKWIILLHNAGCPACRDEVLRLRRLAMVLASANDLTRVALLEVSSAGVGSAPGEADADRCLSGVLDGTRKWHVTTPVSIVIQDGVVMDVSNTVGGLQRVTQ
jgi:hypothetical protein